MRNRAMQVEWIAFRAQGMNVRKLVDVVPALLALQARYFLPADPRFALERPAFDFFALAVGAALPPAADVLLRLFRRKISCGHGVISRGEAPRPGAKLGNAIRGCP